MDPQPVAAPAGRPRPRHAGRGSEHRRLGDGIQAWVAGTSPSTTRFRLVGIHRITTCCSSVTVRMQYRSSSPAAYLTVSLTPYRKILCICGVSCLPAGVPLQLLTSGLPNWPTRAATNILSEQFTAAYKAVPHNTLQQFGLCMTCFTAAGVPLQLCAFGPVNWPMHTMYFSRLWKSRYSALVVLIIVLLISLCWSPAPRNMACEV